MLAAQPVPEIKADPRLSARDRTTIPCDLTSYAREETGPTSWAAHADSPPVEVRISGANDSLLGIWPSDIPSVANIPDEEPVVVADEREALILSLLDGRVSVGYVLDTVGLPGADALGILCDLCDRGVITLDRSQRGRG